MYSGSKFLLKIDLHVLVVTYISVSNKNKLKIKIEYNFFVVGQK